MSSHSERILVVDSDAGELVKLSSYLLSKGYFVVPVKSLDDALDVIKNDPVDLVFADLPAENIGKVSARLGQGVSVPVVIVTHTERAREVVACLRAGASDFILKPVTNFSTVDKIILNILERVRVAKLNQRLYQQLEESNTKLRNGIRELEADQNAGLQIQMKMLPARKMEIGEFYFDHYVKPSLYLSGDFLDYFGLDGKNAEKSLFYFADVSGHGASSAFVTVLLNNLTMRLKRNLRRGSSSDILSPISFLKRCNQEVLDTDIDKHVTMFVGILDAKRRTLTYSVGAHFPMPIMCTCEGGGYLEGKGMPIGIFEDPDFNLYEIELPENFRLTVFSDGILEVIKEGSLADKESQLLKEVSDNPGSIESLCDSMGVTEIQDLPDDIAILTVSDNKFWTDDGSE